MLHTGKCVHLGQLYNYVFFNMYYCRHSVYLGSILRFLRHLNNNYNNVIKLFCQQTLFYRTFNCFSLVYANWSVKGNVLTSFIVTSSFSKIVPPWLTGMLPSGLQGSPSCWRWSPPCTSSPTVEGSPWWPSLCIVCPSRRPAPRSPTAPHSRSQLLEGKRCKIIRFIIANKMALSD